MINEPSQLALEQFADLLLYYNKRINLISRSADLEVIRSHIRHCLVLAQKKFPRGTNVIDWGTGGGLPGIPLAIVFPEVDFVCVDAVGKKIQAVRAMARKLGLTNLEAWHGRAEAWTGKTVYSVSRATAPLKTLWGWHQRVALSPRLKTNDSSWPAGLICLKGGDLTQEITELNEHFSGLEVHWESIRDPEGIVSWEEKCVLTVAEAVDK